MEPGKGRPRLIGRSLELDDGPVWVTSSGLIMSRLGQVSLTKPTYPSMLLSATSEALARLRVSHLTAAAPCGPSLFEHTGFCKQSGPVLDTSQARRVSGSLENDSRPEAIS